MKHPLRIGFDAKRAFWNFSGLGNYSRTLLQNLSRFYPEHNYFLYTPRRSDKAEIKSFLQPPFSLRTAPKNTPGALWRSRLIVSDIQKDALNIYHGLSHELPIGIQKDGVRTVVTIHDLIFLRFPKLYPFVDRKIYLAKIKYACRHADAVIAVSEQTKQDIITYLGTPKNKISVIYQSCADDFNVDYSDKAILATRQKYHLPSQYLLTVGTIEKRKNLMLIAKAVAANKSMPPCVVVGKKTAYFATVQNFLKKNGLSDAFIFLENVAYADLPVIYQGAGLFLYPSRFEGFGIPILEAISSGIPVIAATGSCLEEVGGPESIYIHPDDVDGMKNAIQKILSSAECRQKMALSGRNFSTKFSPKNTSSALMDLYDYLLAK